MCLLLGRGKDVSTTCRRNSDPEEEEAMFAEMAREIGARRRLAEQSRLKRWNDEAREEEAMEPEKARPSSPLTVFDTCSTPEVSRRSTLIISPDRLTE